VNVLLDTNSVLDVLLAREPWQTDAQAIWRAHEDGLITAYVSASSMTDVYYIVRRLVGADIARESVRTCITTFEVCTVDRTVLLDADRLSGPDFEDNVQIACALTAGLAAIVTRDPRGFIDSPITIMSPDELVRRLAIRSRDTGGDEPRETAAEERAPDSD